MRRSRGTRVVASRGLELKVTIRGSGTPAASALARHCEATRVSLPRKGRVHESVRGQSPRRLFLTQSRRAAEVRVKTRTGTVPAELISIEGGPSAPMPSPDGSPVPIPVGRSGEDFPFGFSTKYHDREVGLIAYQLRSYSPCLGRWLNRDPIEEEGGMGLYLFCSGNPIMYYDVLGMIHWMTVLQGAIQVASGTMMAISSIGSLVGSGGMSAPMAYGLTLWASASIETGLRTLAAGLNDAKRPEPLQVRIVEYAYESLMKKRMSESELSIVRSCYYSIDILCSCYSINFTWKSYFKSRSTFIPKYGAEKKIVLPNGMTVEEATFQMRFIGTKLGIASQSISIGIDFYGIFSDLSGMWNENRGVTINPDVDIGGGVKK